MNHLVRTAAVGLAAISIGCGGGGESGGSKSEDGPASLATAYELRGAVEKGPFVKGSTIVVSELDDSLNPTGP